MIAFQSQCILQLIVGLIILILGIVDRTVVQVPCSYLMLPIWAGILAGVSGISGILIGREHKIKGILNLAGISCLRAVNILCIGLSFMSFYFYGLIESAIAINDSTELDTTKGVSGAIMAFCVAEIWVASWMAFMDKKVMIYGGSPAPVQQIPLLSHGTNQNSYQQFGQQPVVQSIPIQQPQQQQQLLYAIPQQQQSGQQQQILLAVPQPQNQVPQQQQQQQLYAVPQSQFILQQQPSVPQPQFILQQQPSGQQQQQPLAVLQQQQQQPSGQQPGRYQPQQHAQQQPFMQQPLQQPTQAVPQTQFLPQHEPENIAEGTTVSAGNHGDDPVNYARKPKETESDKAKLI